MIKSLILFVCSEIYSSSIAFLAYSSKSASLVRANFRGRKRPGMFQFGSTPAKRSKNPVTVAPGLDPIHGPCGSPEVEQRSHARFDLDLERRID